MNPNYTFELDRPHYTQPSVQNAHLILCYRNFKHHHHHHHHHSHVGLGINCLHTAKVLRANKVRVDVHPVWTADDINTIINQNPTITHVLVEAPFIGSKEFIILANQHTNINFSCRTHSQLAFLAVEPGAINLIRDYIRNQDQSLNFRISVNSDRIGTVLEQIHGSPILLLPNLYYLDQVQARSWHAPSKLLKIGSFGAIRLMKNHVTAAGAALMIASIYKKDLEFYISVNRQENTGSGSVINSIRNLFNRIPYAKLIEIPWSDWSDFRHIIGNLDLHIQTSMSETFNITTADAVSMGIPTVSSAALAWVPKRWIADIDDANDIARVGWQLLNEAHAAFDGMAHLRSFNQQSLSLWLQWLNGDHKTMPNYHLQ
jgi:hypothetical protein